jgi:hypothetical protein
MRFGRAQCPSEAGGAVVKVEKSQRLQQGRWRQSPANQSARQDSPLTGKNTGNFDFLHNDIGERLLDSETDLFGIQLPLAHSS